MFVDSIGDQGEIKGAAQALHSDDRRVTDKLNKTKTETNTNTKTKTKTNTNTNTKTKTKTKRKTGTNTKKKTFVKGERQKELPKRSTRTTDQSRTN